MDRASVLSGAPFRSALLSALIFLIILAATGTIAYKYVQSTMLAVLESHLRAEQILFSNILRESGPEGVLKVVRQLEQSAPTEDRAVGLFTRAGARLAGNIQEAPDFISWSRQNLTIGYSPTGNPQTLRNERLPFYASTLSVQKNVLVVGRNLDLVIATERTLVRALSLAGLVVVATILITGYVVSRQSLRKLEGLEDTLDRVSKGDMTARLAVSPQNDQIDRISRRVNSHLDRLSSLMIATRATAAAIAHDLKTPLARAFLGLEKAISQVEHGKDPKSAIESSQAELSRLNAIFETVLRIVRIEAREDKAGFARTDLGELADDLAETYEIVAEEKGQTLRVDHAGAGPFEVLGDAQMLQQLIVNLLQNAVNHCPSGAQVTISLDRDNGHVRLIVADNGPGIPEHDFNRVFEPFFRVDANGVDQGSGLGLALVKSVADRHGATVSLADNSPGLKVVVAFPDASGLRA